jgi:hypothetical protein
MDIILDDKGEKILTWPVVIAGCAAGLLVTIVVVGA